ncbi:DUF1206 domain-containing protein [Nocardioides sp.]|uniref:DUF1206 domain-containing protein n=1 Tax=Nocardioides sp. TaxID=35761 RepID=UPI002735A945|nr:DUF1206 domain-containing protein [Nocardioides sp.]MDP3890265.1 DUF1206 domain-containing protein [Nocardioides sp.]
MTTTRSAGRGEQVNDNGALEGLARLGLLAYGVVHLLIAWLALQLAWGAAAGKDADPSGAMKTLADQSWGEVVLWLVAAGLAALALWQATEAIWGHRHRDGAHRLRKQVTSAAKTVVYAVLGYNAASVALGNGSSSSKTQQDATEGVLAWPGGQTLVTVAGLVVIAVGVYLVSKGVRASFLKDLNTMSFSPGVRRAVKRLGQVGYIAKGAGLALVGGLLAWAAVTFDADKARGLDGALQTVLQQPFGSYLLTAVALGFAAYGVFAMLQSRYLRM